MKMLFSLELIEMRFEYTVKCPQCGEEHLTEEVEFLNVEEDMEGRDVFYYVCPVTKEKTQSLVYTKRY